MGEIGPDDVPPIVEVDTEGADVEVEDVVEMAAEDVGLMDIGA